MPIVETKRVLTFTEEEKEILNKAIAIIENIDSDLCNNSCCRFCPFSSLCAYNYNADKIEKQLNEMLDN